MLFAKSMCYIIESSLIQLMSLFTMLMLNQYSPKTIVEEWWDGAPEAGPKTRPASEFSEPRPTLSSLTVNNNELKHLGLIQVVWNILCDESFVDRMTAYTNATNIKERANNNPHTHTITTSCPRNMRTHTNHHSYRHTSKHPAKP